MESTQIKAAVMEQYGKVAKGEATCGSLCGCTDNAEGLAITFGYSPAELATLPEGANLGLSCGNPQAVAAMKPRSWNRKTKPNGIGMNERMMREALTKMQTAGITTRAPRNLLTQRSAIHPPINVPGIPPATARTAKTPMAFPCV